jgi:hypothetical protein
METHRFTGCLTRNPRMLNSSPDALRPVNLVFAQQFFQRLYQLVFRKVFVYGSMIGNGNVPGFFGYDNGQRVGIFGNA